MGGCHSHQQLGELGEEGECYHPRCHHPAPAGTVHHVEDKPRSLNITDSDLCKRKPDK